MSVPSDTPSDRLRFPAAELVGRATTMLTAEGMDADKSEVVARIMVEGDLLGHDTHGLALLPAYMRALRDGTLRGRGDPQVLKNSGAVALWDGEWLSGVWLTAAAVDVAVEKATALGMGAVSIRRAHHNACLQAYLQRATDKGLMVIIAASDPSNASVAPFGGLDRILGPDPIAIGIPTETDPILIDMSSSITTNGIAARVGDAGARLPGHWVQDAAGVLTDDPSVLRRRPPGSLLLTGGLEHGHKGFGMALTVEALTHGFSGHGRRQRESRWTQSIYVQVMDPEFFSGLTEYTAETSFLADLCHASRTRNPGSQVRMPGERALAHKREAMSNGVPLRAEIATAIGLQG